MTRPFRMFATGLRSAYKLFMSMLKATLRPGFRLAVRTVLHPYFMPHIKAFLIRSPWIYQRCKKFAQRYRVLNIYAHYAHAESRRKASDIPPERSAMTVRARRIYADLKSAIEKNKGGH